MRPNVLRIVVCLGLYLFSVNTGFAATEKPEAKSSSEYVSAAWAAFAAGDLDAVLKASADCETHYSAAALQMQARLKDFPEGKKGEVFRYAALNDVATALFIKGESLRKAGMKAEARQAFDSLVRDYRFGQCWDPRGWFWRPAEAAQARLLIMQADDGYDYGDLRSETMVRKAWESLEADAYPAAISFADKGILLYAGKAREMQGELSDFPQGEPTAIFKFWALNDVATALFIKGEALRNEGRDMDARVVYETLLREYRFGQCWDPRGWFWRPSEVAEQIIQDL